ncbi:MAG: hypothetical protein ABJF04_24725 [Reichenbachiella sp.]|uniref:hypothetical protein n=1 Tax=Reichenbachiella sp. TaxID=2184521 RepID=UPI003263ADE2
MNIRSSIRKVLRKKKADPIRVARANLETQQYKLFEALEEYIWQVKMHGSDEVNQQLDQIMEKYHFFSQKTDWSFDTTNPPE